MFTNRREAGRLLAEKLKEKKLSDFLLFAITRGGVVVGDEIATRLHVSFFPLIVKKIPAPHDTELAIGAVAPENTVYLDKPLITRLNIDKKYITQEIQRCTNELLVRETKYNAKHFPAMRGKTVVLIDDGVATGATAVAAIHYLRKKIPRKIVCAIPVVAQDTFQLLQSMVDLVITLSVPESFRSVGQFYQEFPQVSDREVIDILTSS